MRKKILVIMILAVATLGLIACGNKDEKATDTQSDGNTETGLDWPSEFMSVLPAPDSKISSIDKLNGTDQIAENDTTTKPSSVNVTMNEMTKSEANAYYDKLKSAGFTINTDEKNNDKILLVGTLNDADKNPFVFSYIMKDKFGNVSITIVKALFSQK